MAQVSYISIPPGMEDAYKRVLQAGDRFTFSRVRVKDIFLSRFRVKGITQKSMLVTLSPVWQSFTTEQKTAWNNAGAACGMTGWKLFVQDTTSRRKSGLSGYATPNVLHQNMSGKLVVQAPAVGLQIEQAHPLTYYVSRKVAGTRSQYSPVQVTEPFGFPLALGISYKSELVSAGANARARFYAVVYSSYQGRTLETVVEVPIDLSHDWVRATASISAVTGPVQGYSCFIEITDARGTLYFDNVSIEHNGQNWARDPDCNNIAQGFSKAFFQVAHHWVATNISEGTDFGSVYFV